MFMLLLFYKIVETTFSNFRSGFHRFILKYTEFVHETSHVKSPKYDSTSGAKISILEKIGGMMQWIGTSTLNISVSHSIENALLS